MFTLFVMYNRGVWCELIMLFRNNTGYDYNNIHKRYCWECKQILIDKIVLYLKWTWQCVIYEQFLFLYRLKWYALFINGINETSFYRQWFIYLRQVRLYLYNIAAIFYHYIYYLITKSWTFVYYCNKRWDMPGILA